MLTTVFPPANFLLILPSIGTNPHVAIGRGRPTCCHRSGQTHMLPSIGTDPRVCPLSQGNPAGIAPIPRYTPTENLQVETLQA
ncbi:MAG: hypothetical protein HC865_09540 [Cyanobacteria bacterium RU_5_0]|nr:hypothetical protein [Cyanobacteria bacterium RU_5_0]